MSIDKKVRGGVKITPSALKPTAQIGPPTHVEHVITVAKRLNQITCKLISSLTKRDLGSLC